MQEYLITVVRKTGRNIKFRVYAKSLFEAVEKGKETYRGNNWVTINAREIKGGCK